MLGTTCAQDKRQKWIWGTIRVCQIRLSFLKQLKSLTLYLIKKKHETKTCAFVHSPQWTLFDENAIQFGVFKGVKKGFYLRTAHYGCYFDTALNIKDVSKIFENRFWFNN